MLSKFELKSLKQKLWATVAVSFVARVIVFLALPGRPSSLAPDEATYASLAKWIGQSNPADEFPAYGQGLYLSGRTVIIPASFLFRVGIHELDAVRLVSSVYGLCSLILIVGMILMLYKKFVFESEKNKIDEGLVVVLVIIFAFLPSHFMWTNLGLREGPTEFWILASFCTFFMLYHHQKKITALGILTLAGSIAFSFSARPQVGWVIGISMITYLFFNLRQINTYFMICVVVCGVVLGTTLNQGTTINQGTTGTTGTTGSPLTQGSSGNIFGDALQPLLKAGELVSYKQEVNKLDAASVIETQSCPRETSSVSLSPPKKLDTYFCIAWRAPYMVTTFLFRPFVIGDVSSTVSLFAAVENLFWMTFLATLFALMIKRRRISFPKPLIPPVIFCGLYVLGASAYQGNMGTGFRHKSLILWVVLLMIFALAGRKAENLAENTRNNSQESAV